MPEFELSFFAISALAGIVLFSAFISSATGTAGGVLMFSAMTAFVPLQPLIAIHGAIQSISNAFRSALLFRYIRPLGFVCFSLGCFIGVYITTLFLLNFISTGAPLLILAGLISYSLFPPARFSQLEISEPAFFWVGIATGSIGIIAGAVDPILGAFFLRKDYSKEEIVANKSAMQMVTHLCKIPAFLFLGFSFLDNFQLILVLSIIALLGTWIGVTVLKRMNTGLFHTLMWWGLFFAGINIIYKIFQTYGYF